jgi:hypothetical protein
MLKKTITYEGLDGTTITEDFYFDLNETELSKMHMSTKGGMDVYIQRIVAEDDRAAIIGSFEEILSKAIGRKSDDGKRFIKTENVWLEFSQTDAYNKLFMELLTDAKAAADFIKGIVPKKLSEKMGEVKTPDTLELPGKPKRLEDYTRYELEHMPQQELADLLERHPGNVPKEILVLAMRRNAAN